MFHYDCGASVYGISYPEGHLFRKIGNNPLINDFGAYVLWKFQNMKCFLVHEDTVIADNSLPTTGAMTPEQLVPWIPTTLIPSGTMGIFLTTLSTVA